MTLAGVVVCVCAAAPAFGTLHYIGILGEGGTGTGNTQNVMSIANNGPASGCVFWNGTDTDSGADDCPVVGLSLEILGGDEQSQTNTYTISDPDLFWASGWDVGIAFNPAEPGGATGITLENLVVFFQEPDGTLIWSGSIEAPHVFDAVDSGNGNSGFAFGLDAPQVADLDTAIGALGGWAANPDIRIGAAAGIGADATGSPERIFLFNRNDAASMPEPATYVLAGLGLTALAFWRRRKAAR